MARICVLLLSCTRREANALPTLAQVLSSVPWFKNRRVGRHLFQSTTGSISRKWKIASLSSPFRCGYITVSPRPRRRVWSGEGVCCCSQFREKKVTVNSETHVFNTTRCWNAAVNCGELFDSCQSATPIYSVKTFTESNNSIKHL